MKSCLILKIYHSPNPGPKIIFTMWSSRNEDWFSLAQPDWVEPAVKISDTSFRHVPVLLSPLPAMPVVTVQGHRPFSPSPCPVPSPASFSRYTLLCNS